MKNLKSNISGLDIKFRKGFNYRTAVLKFLTTRQGSTESNDSYMKRFNANVKTLKLSGGSHIVCSPNLVLSENDEARGDEVKSEMRNFKAMFVLNLADTTRHDELIE